ncbi:endonuclease/exonuclease/phosphatase family protein [Microbulbifer sp. DLAB2-AF]|uniref:endonuclease/exonuclease/phosphatase family protein n=1 Tax=Microbulbifer sp. DLAB2-AF TaxID=3243395 RepID=UPI00403A619E
MKKTSLRNKLFLLTLIFFTFSAKAALGDQKKIKIMSYNILCENCPLYKKQVSHWHIRRNLIYSIIEEKDPDIIGLQEVKGSQYNDIFSRFKPEYEIVEAEADKDFYNLILYKKRRFTKDETNSGSELFPKSNKNGAAIKNQMWVTLIDNDDENKNKFTFVNTHFCHVDPDIRLASAAKIMEKHESRTNPTIIVGDLNSKPNSLPIKEITDKTRFTNLQCETTNSCSSSHVSLSSTHIKSSELKIDWLLGDHTIIRSSPYIAGDSQSGYESSFLIPTNDRILSLKNAYKTYPSDHFAIGVDVILPD